MGISARGVLSSDQLRTIVEMFKIELQRGEFARQSEKTNSQSRINDRRRLQNANLRFAQIITRRKITSAELMNTSRLQSELTRRINARRGITVYQKGESRPERLYADKNCEFVPGDVVKIALQTEAGVLTSWNDAPGATNCCSRASPMGRHASSLQGYACVAAPGYEGLDAGFTGS